MAGGEKHKLGIPLAAVFIGYLLYAGTEITKPYYEEIVHNRVCEFINKNTDEDDLWSYRSLTRQARLNSRRGWRTNIDLTTISPGY